MHSRFVLRLALSTATILTGFVSVAYAGPPLICHPIEIGQAKSLPQIDWNQKGTGGYDLRNLTRDTLSILDSNPSVLVRMETLRRATIYARHDPQTARELLARLHARAAQSDAGSHPDALAWFDIGYLAETYKQWLGKDELNPAIGLDGYAFVRKAIRLRGEDPQMEFAAALITLSGRENDHQDHVRKAMLGAKSDPLLAQNLASRFRSQTISELLATASDGGPRK
jgi:hypothetical protein